MSKIGMVGGIGPESTVDYYHRLVALYQEKIGDGSFPQIIISSIDMTEMLKLVANKDWNALIEFLSNEINLLYKAGATIGFLSANTPHIVFERLQKLSDIPLISIVESTRRFADSMRLKKLGLLGTLFTMESDFYQKEFDKSNISLVMPNHEEQSFIQDKLMTEIERGIFLDSTRKRLLKIVKRLIQEESIHGLILGCTELPLILTKSEFGIPFLNTTEIHVQSIMKEYLNLNLNYRI